MNKYYINIKVDREERPDVDKVYMNFVQVKQIYLKKRVNKSLTIYILIGGKNITIKRLLCIVIIWDTINYYKVNENDIAKVGTTYRSILFGRGW